MKQTKKQSPQKAVKKHNYQEINIDITRYGLQSLAEALDEFNSMGLRDNEIIEIAIIGIPKVTVLKFKIISWEVPTRKIQDIYKKTKKNLL